MAYPAPDLISLKLGERWQLRLPALGTAGYSWTWRTQGDADAVEVRKGHPATEELEGQPMGTSADTVFTVTAVRPGQVALCLAHRRMWEEDEPPLEVRHYDIVVTA